MRGGYREVLMSVGTVVILLLVLITFDDRVREHIARPVVAHRSTELASTGRELRDFAGVVAGAARHQTIGHAPLLLFTLAAAVLVFFMVRT